MSDLIYIGVMVLFFVVGGLYVRLCDKMWETYGEPHRWNRCVVAVHLPARGHDSAGEIL